MIILNKRNTVFSRLRYFCNGLILKALPSVYKQSFLRYLRLKKEDSVYKFILSERALGKLAKEQYKEIDSFWSKFCRIRYTSHEFYSLSTGFFSKEYVPYSIWRYIIDPYFNDWKRAHYLDNKCYYYRIFSTSDVLLPDLYAYKLNGYWYDANHTVIPIEQVVRIVMSKSECFIKEAVESWGGLGVFYFTPASQNEDSLKRILDSARGDIVIQEGVEQCSELSRINSDSVNTLRILSFLNRDGSSSILSVVLRMGIKGSKVDNTTKGGLSIGVQSDGRLKDVAYNNRGESFLKHPTSQIRFNEIVVPCISEVKSIVLKLCPRFPHFRLISWDFAIDDQLRPVLIEANLCDGGLDSHQLNNGPVFGKETEEILSEVFSNS